MRLEELRALLETARDRRMPHVERLAVTAAVVSEQLKPRGMIATLVGGAAIELHAPGVYTTTGIDLVVEGQSRTALDMAPTELGFTRHARHWVLDDLLVEVPGNWMSDPIDIIHAGALSLRVVRREVVLADRIVGFKHWRSTAYGAQAVALLAIFGESFDEGWLRSRLLTEGADDALAALRTLAKRSGQITEEHLQQTLAQLHAASVRPPDAESI